MIILSRFGDEFGQRVFLQLEREYGSSRVKYFPFSYRIFADDESLVRSCDPPFYPLRGKKDKVIFPAESAKVRNAIKEDGKVIFLNRGASYKNWKPAHEFLNAKFSAEYLKDRKYGFGAAKVCLILPNMPYAKQDKFFYDKEGRLMDGAAITVKHVREDLRKRSDLLISVTPHDFRYTGWVIKGGEGDQEGRKLDENGRVLDHDGKVILPEREDWTGFAYAIDVTPKLLKYVFKQLKNPYILGGDKSTKNAVEYAIRRLGVKGAISKKIRDRYKDNTLECEIVGLPEDLSKMDLIIVDDVVITATTVKEGCIDKIKENRDPNKMPKSITVAGVTGEFSHNEKYGKSGLDVLLDAGADVVVTNTLETPVSKVDVTEDVSNGIKRLYEEGFF